MLSSRKKKNMFELRSLGQRLRRLCKKNPMDGATADEIIGIIREHQFDPEVINAHLPGQMTPIMCAYYQPCAVGSLNYAIVEEFLKTKCVDVSHAYLNKRTLLHAAAMRGHDKIGSALLERNIIDINAKDCDGSTALIFAADVTPELAVKLLEFENVDVSSVSHDRKTTERRTALHAVINSQHYTDVNKAFVVEKMLMKPGIDVDARYYGPLKVTPDDGYLYVTYTKTKSALNGYTPLMLAANRQYDSIVRQLLQARANCELHSDNSSSALNCTSNQATRQIIWDEMNRRAAHWPRCRESIFARTYAAMESYHRGLPKEVAAMITQNMIVESTGLTAEDQVLLTQHNQEIVNHAYARAKLKR